MPAAGFKVVEIVRRRDFHHAGAEGRVGQVVDDHRNLAIHQRKLHRAAVQVEIPLVLGVHRDGGIAQHGLGPGGSHGDGRAGHAVDGVADVPQVTGHVGVGHFQVGDRRLAARAPVDHVLAAVD